MLMGAKKIALFLTLKYSHAHSILILPTNAATEKKSIKNDISSEILSKSSILSRKKHNHKQYFLPYNPYTQVRTNGLSRIHHKYLNYLGTSA